MTTTISGGAALGNTSLLKTDDPAVIAFIQQPHQPGAALAPPATRKGDVWEVSYHTIRALKDAGLL